MNLLMLNMVLALMWVAVTGDFEAWNFILGFAISYGALYLLRLAWRDSGYFQDYGQSWRLAKLFIRELFKANLTVAGQVLGRPVNRIKPALIRVPISLESDVQITLLANMITLTPGTLTVDVAPDRSCLYVHALDGADPEAIIADIKQGFEASVRETLGPRPPASALPQSTEARQP